MPSPDEVATLDIPDALPLLILTRITLTAADRPLLPEELYLSGHRTQIISTRL
jgi:GntR family transcriptional regulator